jgi:hypothetical protein
MGNSHLNPVDSGDFVPFPKTILPPSEKGMKYTIQYAKAAYHNYANKGNSYFNNSTVDRFRSDRQYAEGNQPTGKYKDWFALEVDNKTGKRKGLDNLDYSIAPYAPKIVHSTIKLLTETTNKINVVFLDDFSLDEKKREKYKLQMYAENKEFLQGIDKQRGMQTPMPEYIPDDREELDIWAENGGIRLPLEVAMEQGLNYTFNYMAKWDKKISPQIKKDLISCGVAGCMDFKDPLTGQIDIRMMDPEFCILSGSAELDFSTSQYCGERRFLTILDVAQGYKNTTGKNIDEEVLQKIATEYQNKFSNSTFDQSNTSSYDTWMDIPLSKNQRKLAPYKVEVFDFVYLSIDKINDPVGKMEKQYHKSKNIHRKEKKNGKFQKDENGWYKMVKKKETVNVQVWRRGKWVVGTDFAYDYGKMYNQVLSDEYKPVKPFHFRRVNTKSIIEVIRPNLDQLQLAWLKLQNALAKARPAGVAIEKDALDKIKLGGEDYDPMKLIRLWGLEGVFVWGKNTGGVPEEYDSKTPFPFHELEGGMGRSLNEILSVISYHINMIQQNTGLNEIALASNPNPETGLGQSQIALTGATNAISNIYDAYKDIKESVAYNVALRLQVEAKENKNNKVYQKILGKEFWAELGKKDHPTINKLGVKVIDNPTAEQKQMIINMINMSLNGGRSGTPSLSPAEALYFWTKVEEGEPLMMIYLTLKKKERLAEKKADKKNTEMMQYQTQANQQFEQQKQQGKQQEINLDTKAGMAIQEQKYDLEDRNDALQLSREMATNKTQQ